MLFSLKQEAPASIGGGAFTQQQGVRGLCHLCCCYIYVTNVIYVGAREASNIKGCTARKTTFLIITATFLIIITTFLIINYYFFD